ncbi:sterol desaturase family protein [Sediminitomix flava]|uniref:Sterol desaturase/sphingolipid hydroxylase (Fatty acid hydroxylase superfamily) n=1 Tax=Sediminitomix flava TaxID=379075 RepID=A0A315ZHF9_SEDFL|nr:sterol desaturase family protein [Sediminitomix flava]PWJ45045.1 sterol desaturase/sphingolipid hydroxylase (fatty acid hydroxylase superfamily) [Sediminitomix flava]
METYAKTLLYAIPGFVILLLIEFVYGYFKGKQTYRAMDTIAGLSAGISNIIKSTLGLTIMIVSYDWVAERISIFQIEDTLTVYIIGFICIDFAGYWAHRLNHTINYFWNIHLVHHSSEEFNLACALRQTISNIFGYYGLFLIPAALLGVPATVIAIISPIHLFLQFWYHTKHIPKLGWLEYIIITPSQHRVHHAINKEYLDKNLGQIFCLWDRIFGTFQEELDDVPPVYGITRPVNTWNPFKINFSHLWILIKDAWHTNNYWDKLRIWFMPLGWRPSDVIEKFPIPYIEDPYNFEKYEPQLSKGLSLWSWVQFITTLVLMLFMFGTFAEIGFPQLFVYGTFLFISIYGYTAMMDKDISGNVVEILRGVSGISYITLFEGWFTLDNYVAFGSEIMLAYFALSIFMAIYFWKEIIYTTPQKKDKIDQLTPQV